MDIRTYLERANTFLHVKEYGAFVEYIRKKNITFDSMERLVEAFFQFFPHSSCSFVSKVELLSQVVLGMAFCIGLLFGVLFFQKSININLFLVLSIIVPFVFMIVSGLRIFLYRFPLKKERTFFDYFLSEEMKINAEDSHVLKLYSFMVFQKAAIAYAFGILLSTMFLFFVNKVDFNYDNTYDLSVAFEQKFVDFFAILWSWFSPEFVPQLGDIDQSRGSFAVFILLSIVLWNILPRALLLGVVYGKYHRAILNAFELKTKKLRQLLEHSVQVHRSSLEEKKLQEKSPIQIVRKNFHVKTIYRLFYEMDPCEIVLDEKTLIDKPQKSFAVATFDIEEEEEKRIINELENLVIVFPSPQTLPDESFKSFLKKILQNEAVLQIWVVVTIQTQYGIEIALKSDKNYAEWHYQINRVINDLRVRLYHER